MTSLSYGDKNIIGLHIPIGKTSMHSQDVCNSGTRWLQLKGIYRVNEAQNNDSVNKTVGTA